MEKRDISEKGETIYDLILNRLKTGKHDLYGCIRQVSRFQRESRFKAQNHALTLTPIILTLTQKSTN
jgi:hypothetical protein